MGLNEGVHSHLSSCTCRVGVVGGWCRYPGGVVEKGSTAVGSQGDSQELAEVMALRQGHAFTGNSSFGRADMTIGLMCTLRGAQATEKAAQLGLLLIIIIIIIIIITYIYNALNDAWSAPRIHNKLKTILSKYIHIQNRQS